jgi:hypothetical protein
MTVTNRGIALGNVSFKFKRGLTQKLTLQNPLDVLIDDKESIKVSPDTSVLTDVAEGSHTLKLWLMSQDKEMGVVNSKIDVHANNKYEVIYTYDTLSANGKVTVNVTAS